MPDEHPLWPYVQRFIEHYKGDKQVHDYKYRLRNFIRFLGETYPSIKEPRDISQRHIESYMEYCRNNKNKPISINVKVVAIRKFLNYLLRFEKVIPFNPAYNVQLEKRPAMPELTTYIDKYSINRLLNAYKTLKYGEMDTLICLLMALEGLRMSEIFKLRTFDIDESRRTISVNRYKQYEPTIIHMVNPVYEAYKRYMAIRPELTRGKQMAELFITARGPYRQTSFEKKFKKAAELSGLSGYTPKHLRSAFLVYMANSVSENILSHISGQKHLSKYYKAELQNNPIIKEISVK